MGGDGGAASPSRNSTTGAKAASCLIAVNASCRANRANESASNLQRRNQGTAAGLIGQAPATHEVDSAAD